MSAAITSVSHDPSEIIIICWSRNIFFENSSAAKKICGNSVKFFQDSVMNTKFKCTEFIWNKKNCNITNVTFDQFNASSLNTAKLLIPLK